MVVKIRAAVCVAMIWVATVACVSVSAWVAIDRAGRDITGGVLASLPPVTLGSTLSTTTPQGDPSPTDATPEPSVTREPSGTPKPTGTTGPSASSEPSAKPEPSTTAKAATTAKPSTTSRDRTFSVEGGQVSVRCTDSTIRLRIAQPDNGWRVEVEKAGLEEVKVTFRRGDSEDLGGGRVSAVCTAGTPTFQTETDH